MKKRTLVFADAASLVDFLLIYKIKNADVNAVDLTISGPVSEKLFATAVAEYGAEIRKTKEENATNANEAFAAHQNKKRSTVTN